MNDKFKVTMLVWNEDRFASLPTWFVNRREGEVTWFQIKELYDAGYDVVVKHWTFEDGSIGMLLAVE